MGYRINRAIGWGMEWNDFEATTLFNCEAHETMDRLHDLFISKDLTDLIVPRDERRRTFNERHVPAIIEGDLLATRFSDNGRRRVEKGNPSDLFAIIDLGDYDEIHICFFPNLSYARKWRRYDDDLDYGFERWRAEDGGDDGDIAPDRQRDPAPREFVKYLPYGHYPWTNSLMLEDGTPQEWPHFVELRHRPDIVPAVPSEIRWYLKNLKILDDAGINKLRPILAQWWS